MITAFDDFLVHQTSEPIDQPGPSDRNFYDRYWFNGFDPDGSFVFAIGFGLYPNRRVMDGHVTFVKDGVQHSFHASRRAPRERNEMRIGPLRIEVVTPMRVVRVRLEPNDTGIHCDLVFRARTVPTQEPRNVLFEAGRRIMDATRFTQLGGWEGYVGAGDVRIEANAARTLGTRDRSWGVRPVGEPEGGAPSLPDREPGVYWVWAPLFFGDVCTHFQTFEDRDGRATQVGGSMVPIHASPNDIPDGEDPAHREMARAAHRIRWRKGTRLAESAEIDLSTAEGNEHRITLEPMIRFQMLGIGYLHPEWGHGLWKGEEVIGAESWALDDLDLLDLKHNHNQQICRARMGDRTGVGTLETLVIGRHDPSGFKSLLDGAA